MTFFIKKEELKILPVARNIYTGIGSRETPEEIKKIFGDLSYILYKKGHILRSGHAKGADKAFETNKNPKNEIYVIKNNYNEKNLIIPTKKELQIGFSFVYELGLHKHKERLKKKSSIDLHSRNVMQILGRNFNLKSRAVFCYTKDGAKTFNDVDQDYTGGTGTAIALADICNIPVYNLKNENDLNFVLNFIENNKHLLNKKKSYKI